MCVNYLSARQRTLREEFLTEPPEDDWDEEIWQDYDAPIILAGDLARQAVIANYGFIPQATLPAGARFSTMNARAETISQLKSYRDAWQQSQLCLVPMHSFFAPCYESGKAVRHQIGLASGEAFAVAGLWRSWIEADRVRYAFTQITINADQHPVMRRMHKPDDEKRSLVIIPETHYDAWLDCKQPRHAAQFLRHAGELTTTALPRFDPQAPLF